MLRPPTIFKNFNVISLAKRLRDCLQGPFWQFRAITDDDGKHLFFVQYAEGLKNDTQKLRWQHLVSTASKREAQQLILALNAAFESTASNLYEL